MSRKTGGIVLLILMLGLSASLLNCGSSNSRPAGVLFLTSQGSNIVESYAVNLGNGDLSKLNTSAPTDSAPSRIILDPTGAVAYVLNNVSGTITAYTVNSNGSLSPAGSTSVAVQNPVAMARDAAGKFLFVASQGSIPPPACTFPGADPTACPHLSIFSIQPGSTNLTLATGDCATSGDQNPCPLAQVPTAVTASITVTVPDPTDSAVNITGPLLYVTGNKDLDGSNDNTVSEFIVDQSSGNLRQLPLFNRPYTTGTLPSAVLAVHTPANSLFVYVADGKPDNNITIFHVCTELTSSCPQADLDIAKLTSVASISVGISPLDIITDPTRNFLYVANSGSNTVSSFRIDPNAGKISPLNPATVSTGATPVALAIHSSGKFLYASNSGSGSGEGSVSGFTVNTTSGSLSGGVQVSSSAQPAGLAVK
jgi:6-phosphogluconolactonase